MKGLLGRKLGMTQVFTEDGVLIPVTVVEVTPNVVLQKKTVETDGYNAVQLGFEEIKEKRTTKANIGHCKKANTSPKRFIKEVRDCDMDVNVGDLVNVDIFAAGETVDVIGTSKGKGYNGTIVRNNAHQGPKTHGGFKEHSSHRFISYKRYYFTSRTYYEGYYHGWSRRWIYYYKSKLDSY